MKKIIVLALLSTVGCSTVLSGIGITCQGSIGAQRHNRYHDVMYILTDSPAQKIGLKIGDVLTNLDDIKGFVGTKVTVTWDRTENDVVTHHSAPTVLECLDDMQEKEMRILRFGPDSVEKGAK